MGCNLRVANFVTVTTVASICCCHRMVLVVLAASTVSVVPMPLRVSTDASYEERLSAAKILLQQAPLIDGHNDLPWNIRKYLRNKIQNLNLSTDLQLVKPWRNSNFSQTDLIRLKKGYVSAQFWSVYVPCDSQYLNAVQLLMEQVDVVQRIISVHKEHTMLATSAKDIELAFQTRKLASLMGVEGGHGLGSSMGVIRAVYDLGVRYITLTHRCHTPWAESAELKMGKPNSPGLTPFGKEILRELNRLGMIVDLSHASSRTAREVLRNSRAPVIFSHSAARSICDIPRNVPDDVISLLASNGGIIMISFYPEFLSCGKNATIKDVVAHINHARSMAGVDHVGIGAGYDGMNRTTNGLRDVSKYPELFAELLRDSSWSEQDLKKLAGLNFLRVFRRIEEVRDSLIDEPPSEEIIPIHDIDSRWPCRYKFSNLDASGS